MYLLASAVVTIDCACPKTFHYAANLENFGDWFPGVISIAADNDLPYATAGKRYLETVAVPLHGHRTVPIQVVDASPPQWIATEGDLPVLLPRMEIEFLEAGPNRCEVRWRMLSRNKKLLVRCTVLPLARRVMSRRAKTGLRTLKQLLEEITRTR